MAGEGFSEIQRAFAANIRDPNGAPVPEGVPPERMRVYRELFFNNIESFMATGFPVLHAILKGPRWTALIRDFYREHRANTPLFVEIAGEFVAYLESERMDHPKDPPFLAPLAHYEWVELVLSVREAEPPECMASFIENPLSFRPWLSPLAWLLSYNFPVQRIGPDFLPGDADREEVKLLVYRGRDEEVHFIELNPVTHRLLDALDEHSPETLGELLLAIARDIGHTDPAQVQAYGADLMCDLHEKGVVGVS